MPTTPADILFQSISTLTGGLITDLTTALIAMFAITFICMGFDYLKDIFENKIHARQTTASLDRARSYKGMAELMDDRVSKDYLNARYRSEIRKAAR